MRWFQKRKWKYEPGQDPIRDKAVERLSMLTTDEILTQYDGSYGALGMHMHTAVRRKDVNQFDEAMKHLSIMQAVVDVLKRRLEEAKKSS